MIKRLLLLGLAVNLLWACNSSKDTGNATNDSAYTPNDSIQSEQPIDDAPDIIDTIAVGDKKFFVYFIDKAIFEQYPEYDHSIDPESESKALAKDSTVKRVGDDLIFQFANGQQKIHTNVNSEGDDFARYQYAGYYPALHRHGLDATFYATSYFELLNPDNGDTLRLWTPPVISPDKKYFLCPSLDLGYGFRENGFQLFEVKNKTIVPIGNIILEKYGINEVQWIDNKTLIATYQTREDFSKQRVSFIKMVMQ
ncbi:hypothetical protein [Chitinophaga flava]|uniref:Uncharacterized protein n=1 Tax=Chitinophaga flava TaxID=2259036 RepID=A0A365Y450_9BACT|nr:hypothetical protein [Chitinophaga flava]RBL92675.1 hypothetical protein DF182_08880 [Chitinophaga flava]